MGPEEVRELFEQAVACVREEIAKYRWRSAKGGVMPFGYDAQGIATEVVVQIIEEEERESRGDGIMGGTVRRREAAEPEGNELGAGEATGPAEFGRGGEVVGAPEERREKLKRLVREKVRRLSRLKENRVFVSEWDVLSSGSSGEPSSVLDLLPGRILAPDEALMQKEDLALLEDFARGFAGSIEREAGLGKVFECLWDGIEKRDEIAAELGLSGAAVVGLRRKLNGRLREFVAGMKGPAAEVLEHYGILRQCDAGLLAQRWPAPSGFRLLT